MHDAKNSTEQIPVSSAADKSDTGLCAVELALDPHVEAVSSAWLQPDTAATNHAVAPEDRFVHVTHGRRVERLEALISGVAVAVGDAGRRQQQSCDRSLVSHPSLD